MTATQPTWWTIELEGMPGFETAMKRAHAWFEGAVLDRPPIRFVAHNAFVEQANQDYPSDNLKDRWFDAEFQVETFLKSVEGRRFHGETFPIFWPNLGPEVYAAFYGTTLEYGEVTSWSVPSVRAWDDMARLKLDMGNEYFTKLDEITRLALERLRGKALIGYTDLHPGVDCAAAWRDPQQFCIDLIESPDEARQLIDIAIGDFERIYDYYDAMLKAAGQPSGSWMGIPSFGRMHIPSCDFSSLISPRLFERFCLPVLQREVQTMTHNVFHVDGKGVARHLDMILSVPGVHAIQWVQGVGDDQPIMQWVPLIKEIQARAPVIVDLHQSELDDFMAAVEPEGIFLWIGTHSEEEELDLLKRVARWNGRRVF
ncbi:MAG: hypothetical protein OZ934_09210 [Anaerolineae bacterium]|nr:hypothetical protein [Anaerolineae bacterium]